MSNIVGAALAAGLALGPTAAVAQSGRTAAANDGLPTEAQVQVHGVVPGLGSAPGVILATTEAPAARCSQDAVKAAEGLMAPNDAILTCNDAITSGLGPKADVAGTFVNRGVLLLTMSQPDQAKQDFERALELEPLQAEALVNRAMILLDEGKPQQALADLDRGIALGPERPERAYLTRGMAREDLKDIKGAYADYRTAEALRPGWEPVMKQLSRFKVQSAAR